MAKRLNVNPTQMELRRLKERLKTATRGHKLLKDKSDEMVRRFIICIKKNRALRIEVENELNNALKQFTLAFCLNTTQSLETAVMLPSNHFYLHTEISNIMGVEIPTFKIEAESDSLPPYALTSVSAQTDEAIFGLTKIANRLLSLAEIEKTCNMLADQIQKNRRRVNALEYVLIPEISETIRYIEMKLEENERGNITRIIKVKETINK